jgi:hypothetical protein
LKKGITSIVFCNFKITHNGQTNFTICISPEELKQLIKEVIKKEFIDFKKSGFKRSELLANQIKTMNY